jgi:molybdopterin synthase sulfur carrier subunit
MLITVQYFASVREARGESSDLIELPDNADTKVLLSVLRAGPLSMLEQALFDRLLVAVNQSVVSSAKGLSADDEVALFPPMTGG